MNTITMGEFRELTADVPDGWPVLLMISTEPDAYEPVPADASVDLTGHQVLISDDTHVRKDTP